MVMNKASKRTIKARANRGLSGKDLTKPEKPGNFKIDKKKAKDIWLDIVRFVEIYPPRTVDITGMVARHHGVSATLVNNIRHGRSWNSVTGLPKRNYDR